MTLIASTRIGIKVFRRLPQMRPEASQSPINASRTVPNEPPANLCELRSLRVKPAHGNQFIQNPRLFGMLALNIGLPYRTNNCGTNPRDRPRPGGRWRRALAAHQSPEGNQGALRGRLPQTLRRNAPEGARLLPEERPAASSCAGRRKNFTRTLSTRLADRPIPSSAFASASAVWRWPRATATCASMQPANPASSSRHAASHRVVRSSRTAMIALSSMRRPITCGNMR